MKKRKANRILWLIVGIPMTSVVVGVITIILAVSSGDGPVSIDEQPLSKTSWKQQP